MINFICQYVEAYNKAIAEIKEGRGVIPAFATGAAITGVIYGISVAALIGLGKVLTNVCARMGYHSLASRIVVPTLLTNLWTAVAVSVAFSILTILIINKAKPKKKEITEEEIIILSKAEQVIVNKIYDTLNLNKDKVVYILAKLEGIEIENIKKTLEKEKPEHLFFLQITHGLLRACAWERKELTQNESKLMTTIKDKIGFYQDEGNYSIPCNDSTDPDVIALHLQVAYSRLWFTLDDKTYDTLTKQYVRKLCWKTKEEI